MADKVAGIVARGVGEAARAGLLLLELLGRRLLVLVLWRRWLLMLLLLSVWRELVGWHVHHGA